VSHPLQLPPFHEGRTQPPTCARSAAGENIRRWSTHVEQGLHRDELGPRELPGAQRASDLVVPRLGVAKPSPGCLGLNPQAERPKDAGSALHDCLSRPIARF